MRVSKVSDGVEEKCSSFQIHSIDTDIALSPKRGIASFRYTKRGWGRNSSGAQHPPILPISVQPCRDAGQAIIPPRRSNQPQLLLNCCIIESCGY